MYATQTIIDYIINSLKTEMQLASGSIVNGSGLCIKDIENKVVSLNVNGSGEREYCGLNDALNTYFYIRLNGQYSQTRKASNTKRGSCGLEAEIRVPLKIVMQHKCADPRLLMDFLNSNLYNINYKMIKWNYDIMNVRLFPGVINIIPWENYQSETGKDPKTLNSLMQIISADFELRYDFTWNDKCDKFKIC